MDAKVVIASMEGKREIPLQSFFKGPGITQCGPKELVVAMKIPKKRRSWLGAFEKLGARCSMAISIVNVAVNLDVVKGIVQDARVAIGAVAPTPMLVEQAAEALRGKPLNCSEMDRAAYFAEKASAPMSDLRGSASYRRKMVHSLTLKCLNRVKAQSELKQ
jgi:carbon-monoxide dehydrogenase medium subunit